MSHESLPLTSQETAGPMPDKRFEQEERARHLCQGGDYATILAAFARPENSGLLEAERERVRQDSTRHHLREAEHSLREADWEMLTVLELFDRATFEHCVRTYTLAKQKIESHGDVGTYLRQKIADEGLTPWDIEHACLLHDMGKIALAPREVILNNTLTNEEWHALFAQFCHGAEGGGETLAAYEAALRTNPELREKDLTPLRIALTPEQHTQLQNNGIDTTLSLGDIIAKHQDISVDIVSRYYDNAALLELIGNHHEKPLSNTESRPVSQSTVRLAALVDTLRIADVFDAIHSERPYKKGEGIFSTLAILCEKAQAGFVDEHLAFLWIEDELGHFDRRSYLHALKAHHSASLEDEQAGYQKVARFLGSFYQEAA